jgi:hypothetical protein
MEERTVSFFNNILHIVKCIPYMVIITICKKSE